MHQWPLHLLLELQTAHFIFCFLKVPDNIIIWTHLVTNKFSGHLISGHRCICFLSVLMCTSGLSYFPATLTLQYCCLSRTGAEVSLLHVNLPLPCFSLLSPLCPSLFRSLLRRDMLTSPQIHPEEFNYCDNITARVINCSLWSPVFRVAQPHICRSFWICHPSFSSDFLQCFSFTSLPFVVSCLYHCCKADVSLILYPPLAFFLLFLLLNLFKL